jgi:hypothetical protein
MTLLPPPEHPTFLQHLLHGWMRMSLCGGMNNQLPWNIQPSYNTCCMHRWACHWHCVEVWIKGSWLGIELRLTTTMTLLLCIKCWCYSIGKAPVMKLRAWDLQQKNGSASYVLDECGAKIRLMSLSSGLMYSRFAKEEWYLYNRVVHGKHFWLHFWLIFACLAEEWSEWSEKWNEKWHEKWLLWTPWKAKITKMKQKCILHGPRQCWQVLDIFKLPLKWLSEISNSLLCVVNIYMPLS